MPKTTPPEQPAPEVMEKLTLELRRGFIVLACLAQVDEPSYGYELQQRLADAGMAIEQGTLYPLLRRLQEQGLLDEQWSTEGSRPRKYYQITAAGRAARKTLQVQWDDMSAVLDTLLTKQGGN